MARRDDPLRKALRDLQVVLSESPGDVNALLQAAELHQKLDEAEQALALFDRAARSYEFQGALLKAVAIRKQMLRLSPSHLPTLEALALLYVDLDLLDEASEHFRAVATIHAQSGRAQDSVGVLKLALERCPADLPLQVALAESYAATGQTRMAVSLLAVVAERVRKDGRWELYDNVLNRMEFLGADPEDAARGHAESALRRGKREEATALIRGLLRRSPRHPRTQTLLRELFDAAASNDDVEL